MSKGKWFCADPEGKNNKDIKSKINNIIELYNNINDNSKLKKEISNKNNEINIIYNTNNQDKIKILYYYFLILFNI